MLARRKMVGQWSGEIFFNKAYRSKYFNRDSAYVLQDDVHIATLTVEETIFNAAWTRMTEGTSKEQMQQRVDMLLEMMGMNHVRSSIVGDGLHKGISGGQLKRLSIAVEIVALPNLIFLDEPTSGK
jgi:ATP-binding cassette subfamily G (WHITE) protein 2